jgi:hypothetical protein
MNRRSFIQLAGSALLLPQPEPVRSYFFAPPGGWTRPDPSNILPPWLRAKVRVVGANLIGDTLHLTLEATMIDPVLSVRTTVKVAQRGNWGPSFWQNMRKDLLLTPRRLRSV